MKVLDVVALTKDQTEADLYAMLPLPAKHLMVLHHISRTVA